MYRYVPVGTVGTVANASWNLYYKNKEDKQRRATIRTMSPYVFEARHYRGEYLVLRHTPLPPKEEGGARRQEECTAADSAERDDDKWISLCITTHEQELNEATYDCDADII